MCGSRSTEDDTGLPCLLGSESGVDGFRFDLASILERDPNGNFHQGSELLWELKNDPELAGIKMIAEPWDAVGGYRLGYPSKNANWA